MNSSHTDPSPHPVKKARSLRFFFAGILALSGVALVVLFVILKSQTPKAKPVEIPANEFVAEVISAAGMVFIGQPGKAEWKQAVVGARLMEGDLVQTDSSGEASIRYASGATVSIQASTIFTVRNAGDGSMEISVPSQEADLAAMAAKPERESLARAAAASGNEPETVALDKVRTKEASPIIKLDRIIPFGRSLELIGSVEAGSRLAVNNEAVDVAGDGSFKHFTNPFPTSTQKVRLILKVTDLAGRTRIITTTHDFDPLGRDN